MIYFSVKTQGFYVNDQFDADILPEDCVEVSGVQEQEIRRAIIEGYNITGVNEGGIIKEPFIS